MRWTQGGPDLPPELLSAGCRNSDSAHREERPPVDEWVAEQKLVFPRDPQDLLGDFWPEEEDIDDFLSAMAEWRGTPGLTQPHGSSS